MTRHQRLRVLVLSSTYPRWAGDPEPSFVHELSRRLADRFDVAVLAPHASGALIEEQLDGVSIRRYRYAPEHWETLVNGGGILTNLRRSVWKWLLLPGFLFGQWLAFRRIVRQFQPDVVHAHWVLPQGLIAAYSRIKVPILATSHGADLFALRGALFGFLRRRVIRRMAAITVVSSAMKTSIAIEASDTRVEIMPMGVDAEDRFRPDGSKRSENDLLFVGRIVEKKGLIHLVHAMPAILAARPNVMLTVIGFGPERTRVESFVAELNLQDHVRFLGGLSQNLLAQHYRRAALFVAPFVEAEGGDQEGLGLVVAEAMACECPTIVGDVPGVRDLVDDTCSVKVNAGDHALLAQTIVELLRDRERTEQLKVAGRARVLKRFAWSLITDRYAELLESLPRNERNE